MAPEFHLKAQSVMNESKNLAAVRIRLDKWLWAARFYKTRSLAGSEVQKGRVRVNGQRAKPARPLQIGDQVSVHKSPYETVVTVEGLSDQRGPATQARLLYAESQASEQARSEISKTLSAERQVMRGLRGEGRPTKRQRRQIIRFQHSSSIDEPPELEPLDLGELDQEQ